MRRTHISKNRSGVSKGLALHALIGLTVVLLTPRAPGQDSKALLASWIGAQTNLQTWSADLVQIRTFKALTQPLKANGRVWFKKPNQFRWELGQPAQTIAMRQDEKLSVIYPKLKRVESLSLSGKKAGTYKDALALLEAGFPQSVSELERQYSVLAQEVTGNTCKLVLQPRSASARKMIPRITIEFETTDLSLTATELAFADGSRMRNEFSNQKINPSLEPGLFSYQAPPDFKVIDSLAR